MKQTLIKIQERLRNEPKWVKICITLVLAGLILELISQLPATEIKLLTREHVAAIRFGKQPKASWKRVGPGILRFQGSWTGDGSSTQQLKSLLNEANEPLELVRILWSGGGETNEAIANAELLLPYRPRIVVEDLCGSSCANYLLPIASEINVKSGATIAYHGTICEVAPSINSCSVEKNFWRQLPNGDKIAQLPLGLRSVDLPLIGNGWMPTPVDFVNAGYPPITFDWYPEPYTQLPGGIYVAPINNKDKK